MLVELCVQVCTVPLGMCNMDFSEMVSVCCVCVCVFECCWEETIAFGQHCEHLSFKSYLHLLDLGQVPKLSPPESIRQN